MSTDRLIPHPAFLAACRRVLGDDSPATVLRAIRDGDPRMTEVHALSVRDPQQWLCSGVDEIGIPRVWAKANTAWDARTRARAAAMDYGDQHLPFREMAPLGEWSFFFYPPDGAVP